MARQVAGSELAVGDRVKLTASIDIEVVELGPRVGEMGKGPDRYVEAQVKILRGAAKGSTRLEFFPLNKTYIVYEGEEGGATVTTEGTVINPDAIITVRCPGRAWVAFQMAAMRDGSAAWMEAQVETLQRGKGTSIIVTGTREQLASLQKHFQATFEMRTGVAPSLYNDYWAAGDAAKAIAKVLR